MTDLKPIFITYYGNSEKEIQELKNFREIGDSFNYLETTFVVLGHYIEDPKTVYKDGMLSYDYSELIMRPLLRTEYMNKQTGVITAKEFSYKHLEVLKKQNKDRV